MLLVKVNLATVFGSLARRGDLAVSGPQAPKLRRTLMTVSGRLFRGGTCDFPCGHWSQ